MTITQDITAAPDQTTTEEEVVPDANGLVADDARWFRTSQMADSLRDATLELIRTGAATADVIAFQSVQYVTLRGTARDLLVESLHAEFDVMVPELPAAPSAGIVFAAVAALARFIDGVQFTTIHLSRLELQRVAEDQMHTQAQRLRQPEAARPAPHPAASTYL